MRIPIVLILLVIVFNVQAQEKSKSISLSISNGGLISDQLGAVYFNYGSTDPTDAGIYKEIMVQLDLRAEFQLKEKTFLSVRGGYGIRHDKGEVDGLGAPFSVKQNYFNLALGFFYRVEIEKFQITTGLEVPFYLIGRYDGSMSNYAPGNEYTIYRNEAGGFSTGLVSATSLRYFIAPKVYLVTTMSFGLLFTKLGGGSSSGGTDYLDPSREDELYDYTNSTYSVFRMSKPEFSLGVGFSF
jgi:hypothetical protein